MKTIYLDPDYMCHLENGEGRREAKTDIFDEIIDAVIPLYRFIPQGEEWTNPKTKVVLHGQFIQITDSEKVDKIQESVYMAQLQEILDVLTGETE